MKRKYEPTNVEKEQLKAIKQEALQIIKSAGVPTVAAENYKITFHNSKNALGTCYFKQQELSFDKSYFNQCMLTERGKKEFMNTMIHECLHAISGVMNSYGHTGYWKECAKLVTANTEYEIKRCADRKVLEEACPNLYKDNVRRSKKHNKVVCSSCGHEWMMGSNAKAVKILKQFNGSCTGMLTCPHCRGTSFKLENF